MNIVITRINVDSLEDSLDVVDGPLEDVSNNSMGGEDSIDGPISDRVTDACRKLLSRFPQIKSIQLNRRRTPKELGRNTSNLSAPELHSFTSKPVMHNCLYGFHFRIPYMGFITTRYPRYETRYHPA